MRNITASRNELPGKKPGSSIAFGIDRTFGRFFQFFGSQGSDPTVDEDHLTQTEMFSLMQKYGKSSSALRNALDDIMLDLDPATGKEYPFNWVRSRDRDRQFSRHAAALEISEADMKKLHDGEEVEISGQTISYKQASEALRYASALGLSFEDAAQFAAFKEARFSEGPKGEKEFEAWMKKQPKSFQDDWKKNKEELESGKELSMGEEEGMMEKSGPAMIAEEVEEAFSQSRSNSYVTDVVREVAEEEACGEYMSEDEDDVFGRMASLLEPLIGEKQASTQEMLKKAFVPDSVDGWLEWEDGTRTASWNPNPWAPGSGERPPSKLTKIEIHSGTGPRTKVIPVRGRSLSDAERLSALLEKAFQGDRRAQSTLQKKYKLSPLEIESATVYIEGPDDERGLGWSDGQGGGFKRIGTRTAAKKEMSKEDRIRHLKGIAKAMQDYLGYEPSQVSDPLTKESLRSVEKEIKELESGKKA